MPASFAATIRAEIAAAGPVSVHDYMAASNVHYYAHADPLARDFATAPELTQVFGEVLGLWAADLRERVGRPETLALAELGPGRGTLMTDALRAAAKAGWTPPVHLMDNSPRLRAEQAACLPHAVLHEDIGGLVKAAPFIVLANEFLDALPVRQFVHIGHGWTERLVSLNDGALTFSYSGDVRPAPPTPAPEDAAPNAVLEIRGDANHLMAVIVAALRLRGGAALFIDYGHTGPATGDTLQAMRGGQPVPVLAYPGEADLTAHVDFAPLVAIAARAGCPVHGPVPQGAFLAHLGLHQRTAALAGLNPAAAPRLRAAALRLTEPAHMGALFKVLAVTAPGWPTPAGF